MVQEVQTGVTPPPAASTCIWERFEETSRTIPDEELDRLPTDLAAQIDHYMYGTPKRWPYNVSLRTRSTGLACSSAGHTA